jgi:hypothetical protein
MENKLKATPGTKFHMVTIIEETEPKRYDNGTLSRMVKVKCDCGNIRDKNLALVLRGEVKSCGCLSGKGDLNVDAVGTKYNMLTITGEAPKRRSKGGTSKRFVKVKCDCGSEEFDVQLRAIVSENTKSCGCSKLNGNRKSNVDYTGKRYGKLTVIKELPGIRNPGGSMIRIMEFKCDCGVIKPLRIGDVIGGRTTSCGCYMRQVSSESNAMNVEIGTKRGYMTLLKETDKVTKYKEDGGMLGSIRYVMVKCDSCGYIEEMTLRRFITESQPNHCGCLVSKTTMGRLNSNKMIIERYYSLEIIKELDEVEYYTHDGVTYKQRMVECVCECGSVNSYKYKDLLLNTIKSCGCKSHFDSHGLCKDENTRRMYNRWKNMLSRCYNQRDVGYHHYGGRGITVCERWRESCENFIEDMGYPPTWEDTNDRIDVDGNYEPENCRWADHKTQCMNKRTNKWYMNGEKNPTI